MVILIIFWVLLTGVKISGKLQSHQKGTMFRDFLIKNPENLEDDGVILPNTPVVIENLPSSTVERGFLKIGNDNTVTNTVTKVEDASKFKFQLNQRIKKKFFRF